VRSARAQTVAPAALAQLQAYGWPGNVRELENVVQRALLLAEGEPRIEPEHLVLADNRAASVVPSTPTVTTGLAGELWEEETRRIVAALETHRGMRRQAAEQLGISDRTLRYKLSKIRAAGIQVPGDRAAALVEQR
jgi:two-component system response regulator FlrC